jgi:D-aminopeptidase
MRSHAVLLLAVLVLPGCLQRRAPSAPPEQSDVASPPAARPRARDLGIVIGHHRPGPLDAITDVRGVRVGHTTLVRGEGRLVPGQGPVRTGVTAVLPHGGDLWHDKVPAAGFVMNGNGEVTGLAWVNEQGALEVPIVLTSTMNIPRAADGVITWMLRRDPHLGVDDDVVVPVVGECDDSELDDARGRHVREADVLAALDGATAGPVAEGAVGAGTGMIAYELKAGIGTASRVVADDEGGYTVGVLVNANMGARGDLVIAGVPVGREMPLPGARGAGRSIVIVAATDAPLDSRQLGRLARRAILGLARTGTPGRHGSGDFVVAFSTAGRVPHRPEAPVRTVAVLDDARLDPLFEAIAESTEEAVVNALLQARTTVGRDGNRAPAIPIEGLREILRAHGR